MRFIPSFVLLHPIIHSSSASRLPKNSSETQILNSIYEFPLINCKRFFILSVLCNWSSSFIETNFLKSFCSNLPSYERVAIFYRVSFQIRQRIQLKLEILSHNASPFEVSCFVIFWLFTIAVKQHFLTFCCFAIRRRRSRAGIMGRKWISGRAKKKKLIFCCCSNVQFTKNRVYWPLTLSWNTFIVSFKHIQPTSQSFKYFFVLLCSFSFV